MLISYSVSSRTLAAPTALLRYARPTALASGFLSRFVRFCVFVEIFCQGSVSVYGGPSIQKKTLFSRPQLTKRRALEVERQIVLVLQPVVLAIKVELEALEEQRDANHNLRQPEARAQAAAWPRSKR